MSSFALDQLKLAFAWHVAQRIVGADGDVQSTESGWLASNFPTSTLASSGFVDGSGAPTDVFEQALDEALRVLPTELTLAARLQLLETFLDASLADDELHHTEGGVLLEAAAMLGVTPQQLDAHLDTLDEVGSVDLDDPE